MELRQYKRLNWIMFFAFTFLLFLILLAETSPVFGPGLAVVIILIMLPLGALGLAMNLSVRERAVDEYGGTPMPGIWGWLGYDVEPDDDDVLDVAPGENPLTGEESAAQLLRDLAQTGGGRRDGGSPQKPPWSRAPGDGPNPESMSSFPSGPPLGTPGARPASPRPSLQQQAGSSLTLEATTGRHCPKCGAWTYGADSRCCRMCGTAFSVTEPR